MMGKFASKGQASATMGLLISLIAFTLTSCNKEPTVNSKESTSQPGKGQVSEDNPVSDMQDMPGTPMKDRVAVLGLLNKRNGKTRDIELKPGQSLKIGDKLVIRLRACERAAPWEATPEIGAFVQLLVNERNFSDQKDDWKKTFSGWLFKENPARNVVQHPVYDVWVKDCRMKWPGEDEIPAALGLKKTPEQLAADAKNTAKAESQEPAVAPKPAAPAIQAVPAPTPAPANEADAPPEDAVEE